MILKRSKELGDRLIVGVSSDKFNKIKKNKEPVYNENDRMEIVRSIKYVDEVFLEESFEEKRNYIKKYNSDIMTMGSDWSGKFDEFNDICKVIILERTKNISTTETIDKILQ